VFLLRAFEHNILGIYRSLAQVKPLSPPGVSLLAARKIWPSTRGEDSVVAILDTGVDYKHPDLKSNIIDGISFVPGEPDYMDKNGHGTHVAGTLAANGQILGIAPAAKILVVKVLNKHGSGTYKGITTGLKYARQWKGPQGQRVNVINMSLGGPEPEKEMYQEILSVINSGITVVCAGGNEGDGREDTREISYPAYYPETIAVGAVNLQTRIANFSNTNDHIDVVAPGVETYSTYPEGRYVKLSGTSMAAPHISGAAALIYSRYKKRFGIYPTSGTVSLLLQYLSIDLGEVGFDNLYGFGMFSFNPDGGKAIQVIPGTKQYYINGQELQWQNAPVAEEATIRGSFSELTEVLGCDSDVTLTDGSPSNSVGKMDIWC
jgi:major intracellular serine protease